MMGLVDTFTGKKVLVTGHTGFKGSWLSLWLSHLGADVTGISENVPTKPSHFNSALIHERITDLSADVCDGDRLRSLVRDIKPDFVFHMAAQSLVKYSYADPVKTWAVNALGTLNMLEALRTLDKRCVATFITSDKCYDNLEWEWGYRETDALGGPDPYSASKGAAELAIRSHVKSFFPADGHILIGVGRAGNVIGGGDWAEDRIVPDCMRAWSRGEIVTLRNPLATRPWQHVLEPLSGYLTLASALDKSPTLHGQAFNFGPSNITSESVGELVSSMTKYWGKVFWEDISAQYGGPYESSLLKLNCDKALHFLKWRATWDFETTVRKTALWYRQYYEYPMESIADLSLDQIKSYMEAAKAEKILWAL